MKKILAACCMLLGLMSTKVLADAMQHLQNRLTKVNSFHACFSHVLTNNDGTLVQNDSGQLWIKRPNLFNWHVISPDESMLISDGYTLWFYNPYINQVTATSVKNATNTMPFMLFMHKNTNIWKQYQVQQNGDNFKLIPKSSNSNLQQLTITITNRGTICSFATVDHTGNHNTYILKKQHTNFTDTTKFTFILPLGVTLDDQRQ